MNIKRAVVVGALALSSIAGMTGTAQAQEKPTTVTVSANTQAKGLASDMLVGEDASLIVTHKLGDIKVKLIRQENWSGIFASDKEYTTLDVSMPFRGWTLTPGVKIVTGDGKDTYGATLSAMKSMEGRTLTVLAGGGSTDVKGGAYWQGKTFDAAALYIRDTAKGKDLKYFSGGIHGANAGAWYSQNAKNDKSITATLDGRVGILIAGKRCTDGTGWALSQFSLGSEPGRDGIYSVGTGQFVSWVMADQVPRPKMRDLDSYLKNGGAAVGQIAYNTDARGEYVELQIGKRIMEKDGIELSLGAGPKYSRGPEGSKWLASAETLLRLPVGGTKVDLTGRFEQKPAGGIDTTLSVSTSYNF